MMAALRRRRLLLLPVAAAGLGACGFELRKAPDFAFHTLFIGTPDSSPLVLQLKRNLAASGKVEVIADPKRLNEADAIFDLLQESRERVVVGMNAAGQVTEMELRLRVRFRLRTPQGKELIPSTELLQRRAISYSETIALAKEAEENLLNRDMVADTAQQLMRRFAAVKEL